MGPPAQTGRACGSLPSAHTGRRAALEAAQCTLRTGLSVAPQEEVRRPSCGSWRLLAQLGAIGSNSGRILAEFCPRKGQESSAGLALRLLRSQTRAVRTGKWWPSVSGGSARGRTAAAPMVGLPALRCGECAATSVRRLAHQPAFLSDSKRLSRAPVCRRLVAADRLQLSAVGPPIMNCGLRDKTGRKCGRAPVP